VDGHGIPHMKTCVLAQKRVLDMLLPLVPKYSGANGASQNSHDFQEAYVQNNRLRHNVCTDDLADPLGHKFDI
jgi:hypothetical protein